MGKRTITAILVCAVMVLVAAVPLAMAGTHQVIKGEKGPNNSAMTWEFVPPDYGTWTGKITNNGLRWLVVDVYDNSTGMLDQISHQRIRFAAYGVFPTGVVNTAGVDMNPTHKYSITVTPNGPRGSTCTVEDMYKTAVPPVALFTWTADGLTVAFDGSGSYDPEGGTVVQWVWDFDDGKTGMGETISHTYAADGTYAVTLTVTDNDGFNNSTTEMVTVAHIKQAPVAMFTPTMDWMTVSVDASASYDPDMQPLTYAWDFGDSMTGSGKIATHTYAAPGTYTITLTVTDTDMLTGTATADVLAKMAIPPVASFTVDVNYLMITVTSTSTDADGWLVAWDWTFGDGESASGETATHTYASDGTYVVTLTVKDNDNLVASASLDVLAEHQEFAPVADFTVVPSWMTAKLDASSSSDPDMQPLTYAWDFGDGMTGSGKVIDHTYAAEGTYTITLTVTDTDMLSDTATASFTAIKPPELLSPIAKMKIVSVDWLNVAVADDGSYDPDGTVVSWDWTFGDGGVASGLTASHSYLAKGTYTITLTVKDNDGLVGTASIDVSVRPAIPPVASFTVAKDWLVVNVDASGSSDADGTIGSYVWNWGDGMTGSGKLATHTYAAKGTYTISLTVTDNDMLSGSSSQDVSVRPAMPPVASFTVAKDWLVVNVDASGSSDTDGTISTYAWNWGDGMTGSGKLATHTYAAKGTYTITLTVTDNDMLSASASQDVSVRPAIPPVASFTVAKDWLVVNVDASGSSDADGTIGSYVWNWGDGMTGSGKVATHTYAAKGTYTITLTVTDNDMLSASASQDVSVRPAIPPVASFTLAKDWLVVNVDASGSSDADGTVDSYAWNFGDGMTGSGKLATHTYAAAGTYTITLTVTDNDMLSASASQDVSVRPAIPPVASFTVDPVYLDVTVVSTSTDADGTIVSWDWTFGDGGVASGMTATHSYAWDGTYTITLTVKDNDNLVGTTSMDVTVKHKPIPPVASFDAVVTHMSVAVTSTSTDSDGTIVSWDWDFGDGATASGPTASHSYSMTGPFTITLAVTDNDGLMTTATEVVNIVDNPPVADFTFTVDGASVSVDAGTSSDDYGIVSYSWNWGDGTTGTGKTATHTYSTPPVPSIGPTSIQGRPPGFPYPTFVFVYLPDGVTPVLGANVKVTNSRTGYVMSGVTDEYGFVQFDANAVEGGGCNNGDILSVVATYGAMTGTSSAVVDWVNSGAAIMYITLEGGGPVAHDYTVTLTVTDALGQTSSISKLVTVYW